MTRPPATLPYIDALRGYAVTLVIASHAFPMLPEMPWTVKRFSNLGFFGVQLFFVVSAVTLARSWRRRERVARPGLRDFMLRRVFRIAPAYFIAALGYLWLLPHPPVDATRAATFLTFTNGWSPAQMPTVPGAWAGVPGGWSIEAEFAFYALFPALVTLVRGAPASLCALAASLPLAWAANRMGMAIHAPLYGATAADQFLYYWLPNQLPVFLCGLAVHEGLGAMAPGGEWAHWGQWLGRRARVLLGVSAVPVLALAFIPWPRLPQPGWGFVSTPLIAAAAFAGVTVALALRPAPFVVNRLAVWLGQASFSAYLVHFAVIEAERRLLPQAVSAATGLAAAAAGVALFLCTLLVAGLLARLTYRCIERPGIQAGAWVNRQLDARAARRLSALPGAASTPPRPPPGPPPRPR